MRWVWNLYTEMEFPNVTRAAFMFGLIHKRGFFGFVRSGQRIGKGWNK